MPALIIISLLIPFFLVLSCTSPEEELAGASASSRLLSLDARLKEQERKSLFLEKRLQFLEANTASKTNNAQNSVGTSSSEVSPINRGITFNLDDGYFDDPFFGAAEPDKIIVIYTDLACEQCTAFLRTTFLLLREKFLASNDTQIRLRDFPLKKSTLGIKLAMTAHCLGERGKYWQFIGALIEEKNLIEDKIASLAAHSSGLEESVISECVKSGKYVKEVEIDKAHGSSLGVQGVPSVVVGRKVSGRMFKGTLIRGNQPLSLILEELEFLK